MQGAKILECARLSKRELINEPCVVKNSCVTVQVIGRTKLPIGDAFRATGDAVKIGSPSPAHSVAYPDVDRIRLESEFVFFRAHDYIENLTAHIPFSTRKLASVPINNADRDSLIIRCCTSARWIAAYSRL